jgi:O-acetyl-ADP-ribose deacetylase (regulator of RNase III)
MITYLKSSIFTSTCQVLTCPVNTDGIMGAGLALQFKQKFPEMFADYRTKCIREELTIGHPYIWRNPTLVASTPGHTRRKSILLFPTKAHYRNPSHPLYIRLGLEHFIQSLNLDVYVGLRSIAFPKLGCGLGGLKWIQDDIKGLMEKYLGELPIRVDIHI